MPDGLVTALAPPPRDVPFSRVLRILFGGVGPQGGLLFFAFGSIFVWVFGGSADVRSLWLGADEVVDGVVVESVETNYSEGDDDSSTPVYAIHFSLGGRKRQGQTFVSYATGWAPSPGTRVSVEVPALDPDDPVIEEARRSPFSVWVLFVVLFPAIGAIMAGLALWNRRHTVGLLREGLVTRGRLVAKEATNTEINDERVYEYVFEFADRNGRRRKAIARTHEGSALEDEAEEAILYDPLHTGRALLIDALPGGLPVGGDGRIPPAPMGSVLKVMILPAVSVLVHVGFALFW